LSKRYGLRLPDTPPSDFPNDFHVLRNIKTGLEKDPPTFLGSCRHPFSKNLRSQTCTEPLKKENLPTPPPFQAPQKQRFVSALFSGGLLSSSTLLGLITGELFSPHVLFLYFGTQEGPPPKKPPLVLCVACPVIVIESLLKSRLSVSCFFPPGSLEDAVFRKISFWLPLPPTRLSFRVFVLPSSEWKKLDFSPKPPDSPFYAVHHPLEM